MGHTKRRRSREELRELVLEAGHEVLLNIEPTLGFADLNYAAVFNHLNETKGIRVTHASVYERIWPSQRAFQFDVLKAALQPVSSDAYSTFADPLTSAIEAADLVTVEGRRQAARELIRIGQNANWDATMLATTSSLRMYHMIRLSLATVQRHSEDPERVQLIELMASLRNDAHNRYVALMRGMCELLGLRTIAALGDPDEALVHVARAANSAAVGFMLDETQAPDATLRMPTGPDGELRDWRPASFAVWSLLRGVFELADDGLEDGNRTL